jgi:hypothetical protein
MTVWQTNPRSETVMNMLFRVLLAALTVVLSLSIAAMPFPATAYNMQPGDIAEHQLVSMSAGPENPDSPIAKQGNANNVPILNDALANTSSAISPTTLGPSLTDLTNGADFIVAGTVTDKVSYWNDEHTRIYTSVILSLEDRLKGVIAQDAITITLAGGEADGMRERVSGTPTFTQGERVVTFLNKLSADQIPQITGLGGQLSGEQFEVYQGLSGKLTVLENRVANLTLEEFKAGVNEIVNGLTIQVEGWGAPLLQSISAYLNSGLSWPHPPTPNISFRINENDAHCTGEGAAVQAAAATWNAAGANFSFNYGGTTSATGYSRNGVNEILWRNLGDVDTVAQTVYWYDYNNNLLECDMEFNDYFLFYTSVPASNAYDVHTVALHELGHYLLLNDLYNSSDSAKVMYGYVSTGTTKRSLDSDDIAGIQNIYGIPVLAVTAQPSASNSSGQSFAIQPRVTVQDTGGYTVSTSNAAVTLAITSGTGTTGAILSGTKTVNAVNGIATFSGLSIDKAGAGYTLTATSPGMTTATTTAFSVSAGPATKLIVTTQPSSGNTSGAAFGTQPRVTIQDASGNTVTTSSAAVTLAITSGTGAAGAVLSGTKTVNALNGIAAFSGLSIDKAGTGYTLTATSPDLTTTATAAFNVSALAATKIAFTTNALSITSGSVSGVVTIQTQDLSGNPSNVIASTTINLTSTSGAGRFDTNSSGPFNGSITSLTIPAGSNAANFYYKDTLVGTPAITAAASGYTSGSQEETVTAGAATKIRVETAPDGSGMVVAAQNLTAGRTLTVYSITRDQYNNFVGNTAGSWSLTGKSGNVVDGDLVASSDNKTAVFTAHSIGTAVIHTASGSLTPTDSGLITVTPKLSVSGYSSPSTAGIAGSITVTAQDLSGTTVTGYTGTVHFGSTDAQAILPANDTFTSGDNGTKTFNVSLMTAGSQSITVTDTVAASITGTQSNITINAAAKNKLMWSAQPSASVNAGATWTAFTVKITDQYGNQTNNTDSVTIVPSSDSLIGTMTRSAVNGLATFNNISRTVAGNLTLTATCGSLTAAPASNAVTVNPASATKIRVETTADGSGMVVPAQNLTAGRTLIVYSITRDQYNNFVDNATAVWSLTGKTGGIADTDLVPAGNNTTAIFSGNLSGTAKIRATYGSLTYTDSGLITVTPKLSVGGYPSPSSAGTTGNVIITAQDGSGATLTGYTGTVHLSSTDPQAVLPSDYTFIGSNNGTKTFSVNLKTAGNQSIMVTDTATASVTGTQSNISINAAAKNKLMWGVQPSASVNAGATWTNFTVKITDQYGNQTNSTDSVTIVPSSDSLAGTLTKSAVSGLATFNNISRTLAGNLTLTATSGSLTAAPASDTITVNPITASKIRVETAADGSGTVVPAQNLASGQTLTVYSIARDQYNNFIENAAARWALTLRSGNVVDDDLVASSDNKAAVFTARSVGAAAIHAESGSLTSIDSGLISVTPKLSVSGYPSPSSAGTVGSFTVTAQDASGTTVTGYTGTVHFGSTDAQAVLPANDTFASGDNGTKTFSITLKTTGSQSITVTDTVTASITGTQNNIIVNPAAASKIKVETAANGSGSVVPAQNLTAGSSLTVYSIGRDQYDNYVSNVAADNWTLTSISAGVVNGDLTASTDKKSAVMTGHLVGTGLIQATGGSLTGTNSGTITVVAGPAAALTVNQSPASIRNVDFIFDVQPWIRVADAAGNPVGGTAVTASLVSGSGALRTTLTAVSGAGGLAKFTDLGYSKTDAFQLHFAAAGTAGINAAAFDPMAAGTAAKVKVETAVSGSGGLVQAQSLTAGSGLTVYSISRDQYDNFVSNIAADNWTLTSTSGGVVSGDLAASGDKKSAIMTGHAAGTGVIHAISGTLASTDSGIITVAAPAFFGGGGTGGGGGGGMSAATLKPVGFASETALSLGENGVRDEAAQLQTADGKLTISIGAKTKLLSSSGSPLSTITLKPLADPPTLPDLSAIVLAYQLGLEGATFDPALTLTIKYGALPAGTDENTVRIVYWNGTTWLSLPGKLDTVNGTINAAINHFSTYAVVARLLAPARFTLSDLTLSSAKVQPGEMMSIETVITNTGGKAGRYKVVLKLNGTEVETKEVSLEAGKTQSVAFQLKQDMAGKYTLDINGKTASLEVAAPSVTTPATTSPQAVIATTQEAQAVMANPTPITKAVVTKEPMLVTPPAKVNWLLWIGLAGGLMVVLVLGVLLLRRKSRSP